MWQGFEWDDEKAKSNLQKHGIRFEEAASVFDDPMSKTIDDGQHSGGEARYLTMGVSSEKNHLSFGIATARNESGLSVLGG
jgi:hypothetical protein